MRVQAGLKPEDWNHWGERTTFKHNAAQLLRKSLRPDRKIYCSPLTDPYQPAEEQVRLMPDILRAIARATVDSPAITFVLQTRGPLLLRDLDLLKAARAIVSFSVTTDRDDVRRIFEPHCAPIEGRWQTIRALRSAGIPVFVTLAPILPCDPEALVGRVLQETDAPIIADPFHVRAVKRSGATTRDAAIATCRRHGWEEWLDPEFQASVLETMETTASRAGRRFGHGSAGFGMLLR